MTVQAGLPGTSVAHRAVVESDKVDPLVPELHEAEQTLDQTLAEACASPPATKADTGELIRVDELLEAASEAAKRAVSLRRRRRADSTQRSTQQGERVAMGDVEAAASADATHRVFTDAGGVQWDAFAVYPESRPSVLAHLKGTYQQGWLCFDSGTEKRRLSPIPDHWQGLSDAQLQELVARAEVAGRQRGRSRGNATPKRPRQSE
jgi:hypothetical protein